MTTKSRTATESADLVKQKFDAFRSFLHEAVTELDETETEGLVAILENFCSRAMERVKSKDRIAARKMAEDYMNIADEEE